MVLLSEASNGERGTLKVQDNKNGGKLNVNVVGASK